MRRAAMWMMAALVLSGCAGMSRTERIAGGAALGAIAGGVAGAGIGIGATLGVAGGLLANAAAER